MIRDRLGLAFFTFAAVVTLLAAFQHPSVLVWAAALHNALLAILYACRKPAQKYDRRGLGLGVLAAFLPLAAPYPEQIPVPVLILGILGYALVLWALLTLGNKFGVAPADRGLVRHGPYRYLRHPMYLGELVLRAALVSTSPHPLAALALMILLGWIQIVRAWREERILAGYEEYARHVRFRLIPGVW